MCGILGIIGKKSRSFEYLKKLNDIQRHRGPDSWGIYQDEKLNVALAMNRLAIIDIADGHQPFVMNNEKLIIVFNGEVYNNLELRRELANRGEKFLTDHAEVETIGTLYNIYGENMLDKLNGMFALAIYDKQRQQLFIARDRFGIKPLYFFNDINSFVFSSELKIIVECVDKNLEIDNQSVVNYFSLGYVLTPKTIYENVSQLAPAHWLKFSIQSGSIDKKRWWKQQYGKNNGVSKEDWPILVRKGLEGAIKRWTMSDVPISYQLSGGLDSSSLVTLAAQMSSKRIRTYSIGFEGTGEENWNEMLIARDVAKKIDSEHTEIVLKPSHLIRDIDQMVACLEQPYAGGLPSWEIFKQISKNEKVAINGSGGDEIFGNYNRGETLQKLIEKKRFELFQKVEFEEFLDFFKYRFSIIKGAELKHVIETERMPKLQSTPDEMFELFNESVGLDIEDRLTKIAIETQMSDEFLMMIDRFSMAHSLEVRTPYLDNEFVDLVLSIPNKIKVEYKNYKSMLKKACGNFLPNSVLIAKKRGFSIPLSLWMRKPLRPIVNDLLNPSELKKGDLLNPVFYEKYVKPMLEGDNNNISLVWSVLMFQMWKNNIYRQ